MKRSWHWKDNISIWRDLRRPQDGALSSNRTHLSTTTTTACQMLRLSGATPNGRSNVQLQGRICWSVNPPSVQIHIAWPKNNYCCWCATKNERSIFKTVGVRHNATCQSYGHANQSTTALFCHIKWAKRWRHPCQRRFAAVHLFKAPFAENYGSMFGCKMSVKHRRKFVNETRFWYSQQYTDRTKPWLMNMKGCSCFISSWNA